MMAKYRFEIVKSAKFDVEADSIEHARSIVEYDKDHYLNKNSHDCYISNGIQVE